MCYDQCGKLEAMPCILHCIVYLVCVVARRAKLRAKAAKAERLEHSTAGIRLRDLQSHFSGGPRGQCNCLLCHLTLYGTRSSKMCVLCGLPVLQLCSVVTVFLHFEAPSRRRSRQKP